jgi:hypothetical protein
MPATRRLAFFRGISRELPIQRSRPCASSHNADDALLLPSSFSGWPRVRPDASGSARRTAPCDGSASSNQKLPLSAAQNRKVFSSSVGHLFRIRCGDSRARCRRHAKPGHEPCHLVDRLSRDRHPGVHDRIPVGKVSAEARDRSSASTWRAQVGSTPPVLRGRAW